MQYHLDGVRPGDPSIQKARPPKPNDDVDVLIVGCGPAGLTLATQLTAYSDISVRIIERKEGPLQFGQADGLACRSLEMFEAFGFAHKVKQEAYWVNEVTFWRPEEASGTLARFNRIQDVEDDLSEMPHVILSQARVHDFYLEEMEKSPHRLVPDYGMELVSLDRRDDHVVATVNGKDGETELVRANYVVGCDGARSTVRREMGLELKGESAKQLWGVMDVLAVTDFPDIRLKCAIQSAEQGSLLIIPREGGYLVRMYIELDELAEGERAADRNVTSEQLIAKAQAIFSPFDLDVKEVSWWSAYEIGQRVCDTFDDGSEDRDPRIFIAGDACHTHSPKAGQGMNVSMADAFNLGWKLASVIRRQAKRELLETYSAERQATAQELIDFDKDMARLFSQKPKTSTEADRFQRYFQKHGRYTAGVETRYTRSAIVGDDKHQGLAKGLTIGMRFHSAPVIRAADAKRVELGHCCKADGRWRLFLFAPANEDGYAAATCVANFLQDKENGLGGLISDDTDPDGIIDVRIVYQQSHKQLDFPKVPTLFRPQKGQHGLVDYEKVFCPDLKNGPDIFDARGIDRELGAIVIVRPDQYVAGIFRPDRPQDYKSLLDLIAV